MPRLEWMGKDKVVRHHLEVPYHVLEKKYDYGAADGSGHPQDNLAALKSLLPRYGGHVKCIYM